MAELIAGWPERNSYQIAAVYAFRDQTEEALEWLQKAYDNGDAGMMIILGDPMFDSVRDEPAFNQIVSDMGLKVIR